MAEPLTPDDATKPQRELDRVGASLRRAYQEAATEPLPDAFEELLRQLQ